jgi:hypothetical protein
LAWAVVGFLVASGTASADGCGDASSSSLLGALGRITCPVVYVGMLLHVPVRFYWAIAANAATYALMGMLVEVLHSQIRHAQAA